MKYKNPWIEVREDQVIRPDGKDGIHGLVTQTPGVTVLPLDESGFVYLVKQFRYALGHDSIEAPAGAVDEGEAVLETAQRELREEVGITATNWTDLGHLDPATSVINASQHLFLAQELVFGEREVEGTEVLEMMKVPSEEAVSMVMDGRITDSPTCVLILKAAQLLKRK